jgi:arsenate reductase
MPENTYNVLFVCTGNSARSILAEGILNGIGGGRFAAFSAGSQPKGTVHPLALDTLQRLHMPHEGFRSKSWEEFASPMAPIMNFVFTVCDAAAGEVCPVWPGQPVTAHWGLADPAAGEATEEQARQKFMNAAVTLKRRLELMLALPLTSLDTLAIQREVRDIGKH